MIDEILSDAEERMGKSIDALQHAFQRIRTGRANPALLEGITVDYYGSETPLNQVANITVEDARTLAIIPWEKKMVPVVEKAILKSDLGLNPSTNNDVIRLPLPALTEETRKDLGKQARGEAENGKVAIRNIRRDAMQDFRDLLKAKEITEDDERRAEDAIQKLTDTFVAQADHALEAKEAELLAI